MIANAAFLAAVTLFLVAAWLAGELVFLAPYKASLFRHHGWFMGGMALGVLWSGRLAELKPVRAFLIENAYVNGETIRLDAASRLRAR